MGCDEGSRARTRSHSIARRGTLLLLLLLLAVVAGRVDALGYPKLGRAFATKAVLLGVALAGSPLPVNGTRNRE